MAGENQFDPDAFLAGPDGFDPDAFLAGGEIDYGQAPWGDVAIEGVKNIPSSAYNLGKNVVNAVVNPVDTGTALAKISGGIVDTGRRKFINMLPENMRPLAERELNLPFEGAIRGSRIEGGEVQPSEGEQMAGAMGDFFADRYGSEEGFKRALAKDPVGVLADLSTVLGGTGALAAKAPGIVGKTGNVLAKTGRVIDPVRMVAKDTATLAKLAGKGASDIVGGLGTHTGGASVRTTAGAGFKGGEALLQTGKAAEKGKRAATALRRSLRGDMPMDEVVGDAKSALANMRKAKSEAYRSGMAKVSADKSILDFDSIDKAISDVRKIGSFKGKSIKRSTSEAMKKLDDVVDEWRKLEPSEYHTPEGMDALKQSIGDIRDATEFGTPSRRMVDKVYHAVKNKISEQAPEYSRTMADYEKGSELVRELEKTLSLGSKASPDTALRKLQSILRDNANTTYGRRVDLAQQLIDAGAPDLMEKLAGQANAPLVPRGLGKLGTFGAGVTGLQSMNPAMIPVVAATSPRLVGEAAYYGGKASGVTSGAARQLEQLLARAGLSTRGVAQGAFQAGRAEDQANSSNR